MGEESLAIYNLEVISNKNDFSILHAVFNASNNDYIGNEYGIIF